MTTELRFPLKNDTSRKIIHIDMDAFYAAVEERDNPRLKGHPLVIAHHPKETRGRGVVTTANYEARKFGIHSAMSAQKAYELCPQANFVPGNLSHYRQVSQEIHQIYQRYTDMIEPLSLDEAYLDVTKNKINSRSAIKIAKLIQRDIWQELELTCSAGVSYNKFIAKLASDYQKPKGLTVIIPGEAEEFLRRLPIEDFYGVGKKTVPRMHELGIFTGEDLRQWDEMTLIQEFGKMGYSLFRKVRGIHDSPVNPHRERKSIGRESTFSRPLRTEEEVIQQLRKLSNRVAASLKKNQKHGQTVVIKVRNIDYETITRRKTLPDFIDAAEDIYFQIKQLWDSLDKKEESIRLLGVTVTNLIPARFENIVLPLYPKKEKRES